MNTRPVAVQAPSKSQAVAGLKAFFNICDKWKCRADEAQRLLGISSPSTYFKYKKTPESAKLSRDTLERISYILNIHAALRVLFTDPASVYGWVRKKNDHPLYGGMSAMEKMTQGRVMDLYEVMTHLNSERGGWA